MVQKQAPHLPSTPEPAPTPHRDRPEDDEQDLTDTREWVYDSATGLPRPRQR